MKFIKYRFIFLMACLLIALPVFASQTGIVSKGSDVVLSLNSLNFGNVVVGEAGDVRDVEYRNSGATDLYIESIEVTGDFEMEDDCGDLIEPDDSCTISVMFSPIGAGVSSGTVEIYGDATDSPQTIMLTGTGYEFSAQSLGLSTTSIDFGKVTTKRSSAPRDVTLTNDGADDLVIGEITISGSGANSYTVENDCRGATLAGGESCSFTVTFKPQTNGTLQALVIIVDNSPEGGQTISLTGVGVGTNASFCALMPGNEVSQSFVLATGVILFCGISIIIMRRRSVGRSKRRVR